MPFNGGNHRLVAGGDCNGGITNIMHVVQCRFFRHILQIGDIATDAEVFPGTGQHN